MKILKNVRPTSEQLKILTDTESGFRLIRGAAGSGKTTAALLRLQQLCSSRLKRNERLNIDQSVHVLVLTFNRTLRGYITELAKTQLPESENLNLEIETFSRWATDIIGRKNIIEDRVRQELLENLLKGIPGSGRNRSYFLDEVAYILGRFHPDERQLYISAPRSGRGRAPAVPRELRARILKEVIKPYEDEKLNLGVWDWHDVAAEAKRQDNKKYDVIIVDEVQDLSANQMRAILSHLKEDHVTTFVIDAAQRIYPQSFKWQEIDIHMRPETVFTLTKNHRNTREIANFASSLVQDVPQEEDGMCPDASTCSQSGRKPQVVRGKFGAQLDYMICSIKPLVNKGESVAILHPTGWFDHTTKKLEHNKIDYCKITRERRWPEGSEQVALSTIHSVKGLEFDHVLMPGLNSEVLPHGDEDGDGTLESLRRLLAMGIGRARKTVMIGYKPQEKSVLIDLFDPKTFEVIEV